jgi:DNA-binding NtrC family response regulator/tetratricopeptide (TPR) repeat protein
MNELLQLIANTKSGIAPDSELWKAIDHLAMDISTSATDLADRITAVVRLLHQAGEVDRALQILDLAAESHDIRVDVRQQAELRFTKGSVLYYSGRTFEAVDFLGGARARFEMCDHHAGVSKTLVMLGASYKALHQWAMAERCYELALETAGRHSLREIGTSAGYNLAIALAKQGRWRPTHRLLKELTAAVSASKDDQLKSDFRLQLATTFRHLGFPERALPAIHGALRYARAINFRRNEAIALEYLGDFYLDGGNAKRALEHYRSALKIGLEIAPEGDLVAEAYRRLAETYYMQGDFEKSERAICEGWRVCDQLHDDFERVGLLRVQAGLALERNDPEESDRLFREATDLCSRRGFRFEQALTLEYHAFAHLTTARPETGDRYLTDAAHVYAELRITRLAVRLGRGRRALSRVRPTRKPARHVVAAQRWERFGIFTRNAEFIRVLDRMERVAGTKLPILIVGESGVGKELVAHAIHTLSARRGRLVDINCPAIPESMLESELFGSVRGAFTGAEDRKGLVAAADGGNLFLDEIGDMPRGLQAKLLRFLETSSYRRVGGSESHTVDVRLISATNAPLESKVSAGRFRRDLYHRIAGMVIEIPPLRHRPEDVELLADEFISRLLGRSAGPIPIIETKAMTRLKSYDWPGNVRELKHALDEVIYTLGSRKRITVEMLPPAIQERVPAIAGHHEGRRMDADAVSREIAYHGGSITEAAKALGMSRQRLYRFIEQSGIDLQKLRGR